MTRTDLELIMTIMLWTMSKSERTKKAPQRYLEFIVGLTEFKDTLYVPTDIQTQSNFLKDRISDARERILRQVVPASLEVVILPTSLEDSKGLGGD